MDISINYIIRSIAVAILWRKAVSHPVLALKDFFLDGLDDHRDERILVGLHLDGAHVVAAAQVVTLVLGFRLSIYYFGATISS